MTQQCHPVLAALKKKEKMSPRSAHFAAEDSRLASAKVRFEATNSLQPQLSNRGSSRGNDTVHHSRMSFSPLLALIAPRATQLAPGQASMET